MPAASVLVLELLRQAQNPAQQAIANRSGIIRDLSILISLCESMTEQGQNNYTICKQAQSIFTKSLDTILNHAAPVSEAPIGQAVPLPSGESNPYIGGVVYGDQAYGGGEFQPDVLQNFTPDWTTWLQSMGLQADPWLDPIMWSNDFPLEQTV